MLPWAAWAEQWALGERIPISPTRTSKTVALVAQPSAATQIDKFGKKQLSADIILNYSAIFKQLKLCSGPCTRITVSYIFHETNKSRGMLQNGFHLTYNRSIQDTNSPYSYNHLWSYAHLLGALMLGSFLVVLANVPFGSLENFRIPSA